MPFLIGIAIAIALFWYSSVQKKKNRAEKDSKLPVLTQVIQGTVQGSAVVGAFMGLPARGSVEVETYRDSDGDRQEAYFWSAQLSVALGAPFTLKLQGKGFLGMGAKELTLDSPDPGYKEWLTAAGLLQYASQVPPLAEGKASLSYQNGILALKSSIDNEGALPTPDLFNYQLQVLMGVVQMHQQPVAAR